MNFVFIGLADSASPYFPPEVLAEIAAGRVFSGGLRHHELVAGLLPVGAEWIDIVTPLDAVFAQYEGRNHIVVFASGDPLFFGFAATVQRRLPHAEMKIYPALNSLTTLAHRAAMPYHDMRTVSLTGRPWDEFDRALIEGTPKIGILTDREHTPAAIARRMLEYGYTGYEMIVGERLGNGEQERVMRLTLSEAAVGDFVMPNCVIVHGKPRRAPFGIPDSEFELLDGRAKMITKMPVRLAALAMLSLSERRVFWDIGFCTGSVSVEARLRFPHLAVRAFEIRPEGARLMEVNSRRHGAPGIEVHIGDFLECSLDGLDGHDGRDGLGSLPHPDAVFIGGHGGRLGEIVERVAGVLVTGGAIVFNSVSEDSRTLFESAIAHAGLKLVARTRIAVDDHNPIEILKAIK
jgi:precorrin-6Y C5,15-methyltransferase (decarboxylating)